MNTSRFDGSRADRRGMLIASLCFVHCVAGPVLLSLAGLSSLISLSEKVEPLFLLGSATLGVIALVPAYRKKHGRVSCLAPFASLPAHAAELVTFTDLTVADDQYTEKARKLAGTDTRPLRSTLFTNVDRNNATAVPHLSHQRPWDLLPSGWAAVSPIWDGMGYHGLNWESMESANKTLGLREFAVNYTDQALVETKDRSHQCWGQL